MRAMRWARIVLMVLGGVFLLRVFLIGLALLNPARRRHVPSPITLPEEFRLRQHYALKLTPTGWL